MEKRKQANKIDFYKPLEQQKPFHETPAQFRYWSTGNRAGKTTAGAAECCWYLEGTHPYRKTPPEGGNVWVVTQTRDQSREAVLEELQKWLPKRIFDPSEGIGKIAYTRNEVPDFIEVHHWYDGRLYKNRVIFKSQEMKRKAFQSASKILVWWDEDIEEQTLYYEARTRFGKYRVDMIITATPLSSKSEWCDSFFEEKEREEPDRYWFSTGGSYAGNTYLDAKERENYAKDIVNDPQKETRISGKRVPVGGLIFPFFEKKDYMLEEAPTLAYLRQCTLYRGLDWGSANGSTGMVWVAIDKGGYITVFREYENVAGADTHIKNITERSYLGPQPMQIIYTVCDWPTIGTTKKGFDIRTEFAVGGKYRFHKDGQKYRIPTIRAAKGPGSVETSIEALTRILLQRDSQGQPVLRFSPEVMILPSQLQKYSRHHVNSVHEKSVVVKRNDHLIDAFKYLVVQGIRYINPDRIKKQNNNNFINMTVTGIPITN